MKTTIDESRKHTHGSASVKVSADALEIETDPIVLGLAPANAIAKAIGDGIRNCNVQASPGTIKRRKAQGISSETKWNATGKLAASIEAQRDQFGYAIVAADDRLKEPGLLAELAQDVPVIDAPITAEVDEAIEQALDTMLQVRKR